jgi:polyisoprenoid-binding protein YceI
MKNIVFVLFLVLSVTGFAQVTKIKSADITFKIKNAGLTVDGKFAGFSAQIQFDPARLSESHIQASVDTKTIDTGIGLRDNHLRKEEYFGVDKFPKIQMNSVKFVAKGGNAYVGTFQLTIKNVTKSVEIPFTFTENNGLSEFKGSFTINRRNYNVGGNSWTMVDNVILNIAVVTEK